MAKLDIDWLYRNYIRFNLFNIFINGKKLAKIRLPEWSLHD